MCYDYHRASLKREMVAMAPASKEYVAAPKAIRIKLINSILSPESDHVKLHPSDLKGFDIGTAHVPIESLIWQVQWSSISSPILSQPPQRNRDSLEAESFAKHTGKSIYVMKRPRRPSRSERGYGEVGMTA